ncbi:AAC(3) family N-acetyltransferase [Candidatus Poribacteria bacterium]
MNQNYLKRERIAHELKKLGAEHGDTLFIHSSFKSLGPVDGGAETVIHGLEDAVGAEGLILMPSFNLEGGRELRSKNWNMATTKSTVGWLTEYFRTMPGTHRSDHYSHSVAARGKGAKALVSEHRCMEGMKSPWDMESWGCTYGSRSPMIKAYNDPRGKLLMLGVDYGSSTYCHVAETMYWDRRLERDPNAQYLYFNRESLGAYWDSLERLKRGFIGCAECRLFSIRDFVDTLFAAVIDDPDNWTESE